ncbi:hypothetical protein ABPG75_012553 [Micractinium tetrahymenae]
MQRMSSRTVVGGAHCQLARQLQEDYSGAPPPLQAGAFYYAELPEAQAACGAKVFAEMQDAWPSAEWLEAIKAGAVEKYNADLASNWRRITCTPLEGARVTCQNKWSPTNFALVFDADCGAAGPATIQAQVSANPDGSVNYWGLVDVLCRAY